MLHRNAAVQELVATWKPIKPGPGGKEVDNRRQPCDDQEVRYPARVFVGMGIGQEGR